MGSVGSGRGSQVHSENGVPGTEREEPVSEPPCPSRLSCTWAGQLEREEEARQARQLLGHSHHHSEWLGRKKLGVAEKKRVH